MQHSVRDERHSCPRRQDSGGARLGERRWGGRGGGGRLQDPPHRGSFPARSSLMWPCSWGHVTNCSQEQFSYSCRCAFPERAAGPHEPPRALPPENDLSHLGREGHPAGQQLSAPSGSACLRGRHSRPSRNSGRHRPEEAATERPTVTGVRVFDGNHATGPQYPMQASQSTPAGEDPEPSGAGRGAEAPASDPGLLAPPGVLAPRRGACLSHLHCLLHVIRSQLHGFHVHFDF